MVSDSDRNRLEALAARIDKAQEASDPARKKSAFSPSGSNRGLIRAVHIGSDFVASVMVPMFVGGIVDRQLGTEPLLMLVFLFAGFALGLYRLVIALDGVKTKKQKRDEDRKE